MLQGPNLLVELNGSDRKRLLALWRSMPLAFPRSQGNPAKTLGSSTRAQGKPIESRTAREMKLACAHSCLGRSPREISIRSNPARRRCTDGCGEIGDDVQVLRLPCNESYPLDSFSEIKKRPARPLSRRLPSPVGLPFRWTLKKAAAAGIEPASGRLTAAYPYQHGSRRNESRAKGRY